MKKLALSLTLVCMLLASTIVFANNKNYQILGNGQIIIDSQEFPMEFSMDKTCYAVEEVNGQLKAKYVNNYSNGWQDLDTKTYVKRYNDRESLGLTY